MRKHDCADELEPFWISALSAFDLYSLPWEVNADKAGKKHICLPDVMTGEYHKHTQTYEHTWTPPRLFPWGTGRKTEFNIGWFLTKHVNRAPGHNAVKCPISSGKHHSQSASQVSKRGMQVPSYRELEVKQRATFGIKSSVTSPQTLIDSFITQPWTWFIYWQ